MYTFTVLLSCVVLIVGISACGEQPIDNKECGRRGGTCMIDSKCTSTETVREICNGRGEKCCPNSNEQRCRSFGGECIDNCPQTIIHLGKDAKDCPKNTNCCVWIR